MYGSIIGSERTAKQMKAVALKDARLINGLDVYETGDGIIDSEMMRGKDFVIIESDGSGTAERFLTRFAEYGNFPRRKGVDFFGVADKLRFDNQCLRFRRCRGKSELFAFVDDD